MKRAKDKYMINRTKYKDIKRYDHQQMEDFLTDVYKNGYADGKESVTGVELQDVEKALQDVKGIGPGRRGHRNGNRANHSLSNDSHGSNHRDRRSNHADLVDICGIRRKRNGER